MVPFAILAMAKEPAPGMVKTRLTPPLSHLLGSRLYEAMLEDTMNTLYSLGEVKKYLFFEPKESRYFDKFARMGIRIQPQEGSELGEKMSGAAGVVADRTGDPVLIIGTDIPLLTPSIITGAASLLAEVDIVIGPCDDGGYYLIGMNQFSHIPFQNIPWSTSEVLQTTISRIREGGLSYDLAEKLYDIDTASDIEKHIAYMRNNPEPNIWESRFSKEAIKIYPHLENQLRPGK